jgi:hypothetical protein
MEEDLTNGTSGTGSEPDAMRPQAGLVMSAPPAPPVPPAPAVTAQPPDGGGEATRRRSFGRGGTVFGVLLVLIGAFALFGGLTSVFDVLRLWPLLIIVGGVMEIVDPRREAPVKRVAEGLGSVALGLVLLCNTFGYLPWTVWFTLASLWPVLLVALGIELVGRGLHMDWVRACSNLVLIVALAYGIFVLQPASGRVALPFASSSTSVAFSDSKPHDPAVTTGSAVIKVGATRLGVTAGDALATISGRAPSGATPTLATSASGSAATVSVDESSGRTVFVGTEDGALDVTLDRAVKWSEVQLDIGAVSGDADLSGLAVDRVQLNVGASDVRLKIGSLAKDVSVDVSGGATSVTVLVPVGAACVVDSTSGLSNVRVPPSFRQTSGIVVIGNSTFVSDATGAPKITISLRSGVSDLRIETY